MFSFLVMKLHSVILIYSRSPLNNDLLHNFYKKTLELYFSRFNGSAPVVLIRFSYVRTSTNSSASTRHAYIEVRNGHKPPVYLTITHY